MTDREQEHIDAIISIVEAGFGRVEVQGDTIVVTLPDTPLRVVYRKPVDEPGLIVSANVRDERMSVAQQTEFLSNAWHLANHKARELGWIV